MSDKANLKKLKKEAELAEVMSTPVVGERFPTTYSWGYRLLQALCSIEERLRNLEQHVTDMERHYVKQIASEATVYLEHTETINSDGHVQSTGEAEIDADSTIS